MKLLLTSAGSRTQAFTTRSSSFWANRSPTPMHFASPPPDTDTRWALRAEHGASLPARSPHADVRAGWKSLGILELTALPSIGKERWEPWVRQADVLLVNGGDALYLCHWMRSRGSRISCVLSEIVWVGLSAGSMVMTPRVGEAFVETKPPTGDDITLGVVDFSIFPHLDYPDFPENTMAASEKWAAGLGCPAYAIDDQTAIKVVDGAATVVSEGHWKFFGR